MRHASTSREARARRFWSRSMCQISQKVVGMEFEFILPDLMLVRSDCRFGSPGTHDLSPKNPHVRACHAVVAESLHFGETGSSLRDHGAAVEIVLPLEFSPSFLHDGDAPVTRLIEGAFEPCGSVHGGERQAMLPCKDASIR